MGKRRTTGKGLRTIAASFTVAVPAGARIRDRLRLSERDIEVLTAVGRHLGSHARADLAERIGIGNVAGKDNRRAERKKRLTAVSSSRWAGAMTRTSEDQYQLALRCLHDECASLRRAITTISKRLAVPCGTREGRVRGYADQDERWQKQRRLQVLTGRLARVEDRITMGRPAVTVGGRRLAKLRHTLADADLSEQQWRRQWEARRMFLTADGETGAPFGNYTITVDPGDGSVTIVLPEPLRHMANAPRGRCRLSSAVRFHHRREDWLDRVQANRAVRYDITYHPERDRWYLDASWSADTLAPPSPDQLTASGARLLSVDLNADHLAACVVDACGNPIGQPITIPTALSGPASRRDGRLRQAISELIRLAHRHGCAGFAIENLGFDDARATGRETMGRGRRGKSFRRTVAGIPTARFRERLRGMAYHRGLVVVAVDRAYTSKWGAQHWQRPLQQQTKQNTKQNTATRHHAAAVAIGRRAFGHGIRRRPGVTARHQRMAARRATGQTASRPTAHGTASPPRTAGTPHRGGKTCRDERPARAVPRTQDRSGCTRTQPRHGPRRCSHYRLIRLRTVSAPRVSQKFHDRCFRRQTASLNVSHT
ncbi:IS200/IS605 family accessory protein TnpB-related protein [Nonomuraea sp. 10N515B]|uniref:IS200/IS605 family accessory protein TnpB-related protein n=1 Tax=Nonomuraea sp. 10N515B TaxID=3457422 RepID=UPI003FCE2233